MALCMVLMPLGLGTRNKILKNRITQSIEETALKMTIFYTRCMITNHESILTKLTANRLVSENTLSTLQQILLVLEEVRLRV